MKLNKESLMVECYGANYVVTFDVRQYPNGRTAILLVTNGGEPFCKLTVNMVDEDDIAESEFFIKNENPEHAIAIQLGLAGIIRRSPKKRFAPSDFSDHYATLWEAVP
jgi:hypothetical protein